MVLPELPGIYAKVIVVDNASADDSLVLLRDWINARGARRFQVIEAETNAGFSAGNNLGMKAVDAEILFAAQ